ncbi:MAG: histidine kinase N-terminal 7TM domain-containing protein [Haloarculaceae archaeon]
MALPFYAPLALLASVVGMAAAATAWLFRERPGAAHLTLFLAAASLWSLAEGLQLASPGLGAKVFWASVELTLSPVVPLAWLATVLAFTGNEEWLSVRTVAVLSIEPAAFVVLVWTNPMHDLVWRTTSLTTVGTVPLLSTTYGLAAWAHLGYSLLLVAAGAFLLVRLILRTNAVFRDQATALLVAVFVPMVAMALSFFGVLPTGIDLTSVGFVVTGLVVAGALLRQDLLELAPVTRDLGREELIDDLDDQVVIVDERDRVVDVNPAAASLFERDVEAVVGDPLGDALPELAATLRDGSGDRADVELQLNGSVRHYSVRVSELYRGYGTLTGRIVSLRDVTERRQREQRLDVMYRLLRHNLRNEMNVIRGNTELLERELDDAHRQRLERIESTVDALVARSDKIGRLSRALDEHDEPTRLNLSVHLRDVAETVRLRFPGATVELDLPDALPVVAEPSVTLAFEELLTNGVQHDESDDPTVRVTAAETDDRVRVCVADDGPGIDDHERLAIVEERETPLQHSSGVGLWLVNWIVGNLGGTIDFEVDGGTTAVVELPRADPDAGDAPDRDGTASKH